MPAERPLSLLKFRRDGRGSTEVLPHRGIECFHITSCRLANKSTSGQRCEQAKRATESPRPRTTRKRTLRKSKLHGVHVGGVKLRNSGHVGGVKYSFGNLINVATGHMSKHTVLQPGIMNVFFRITFNSQTSYEKSG